MTGFAIENRRDPSWRFTVKSIRIHCSTYYRITTPAACIRPMLAHNPRRRCATTAASIPQEIEAAF
jgi:hypothetical protein